MKQVDIPQVLSIFNQIYSSRVTSSLNNTPNKTSGDAAPEEAGDLGDDALPLQQKLLMASLFLLCNRDDKKKCKQVTLGKLQETHSKICRWAGLHFCEKCRVGKRSLADKRR